MISICTSRLPLRLIPFTTLSFLVWLGCTVAAANPAPVEKPAVVAAAQPLTSKSSLVSAPAAGSRPAAAPGGVIVPSGQLLLGMLANHDEEMAKRYAANIEKALGQPVAVRMFEDVGTMVKWFQRYRILDLAVIPRDDRSDILSGDYQLLRNAKRERLVARRDLPADVLKKLAEWLTDSRLPSSSQLPPINLGCSSHA